MQKMDPGIPFETIRAMYHFTDFQELLQDNENFENGNIFAIQIAGSSASHSDMLSVV